jgi:hypothetical protein
MIERRVVQMGWTGDEKNKTFEEKNVESCNSF